VDNHYYILFETPSRKFFANYAPRNWCLYNVFFGAQFKISESAVSHAVSRVSKTIAKDKKVRKKLIN